MNTTLKFIAIAVTGLAFASCCGIDNNHSKGYKEVTKDVTTYKEQVVTVYPSGKGGLPYSKVVQVPTTETVTIREKSKCTSSFTPNSHCGTLGKEVTSRATVQGGTGEPMLGLIPTVKPLVSLEN